jgi:hypothetical protein
MKYTKLKHMSTEGAGHQPQAVFSNITGVAQSFFGYIFPQCKLSIDFEKKLAGPHFGRLFSKLIWSPCSRLGS